LAASGINVGICRMALVRASERSGGAAPERLSNAYDVAGEGVEATYRGRKVRIGRPEFVAAICGGPKPPELSFVADHVQVIALGDENGWIALFTLSDSVRPEARRLVRGLQQQGRKVWLLTGDRKTVAEHVGRELGVDGVVGDARPEDKLDFVRRLQSHLGEVAMVGDGVNDAPVLAQAQVSIALGSGADLAQSNADLVLAECGLERLDEAVSVARKAQQVIKQNFAWALAYNAIAVPAAVLGYVTPLIASIGMATSSAVVVANALRAAHPALWRRDEGTPAGNRQMTRGSAYVLRAN
jgi:Cu2+-exporting ATPase